MKRMSFVLGMLFAGVVSGQAAKPDANAREDIAAHRKIAAAHEKAAKCLEAGKKEKECHAHLATECKDVAIGKYCGMRHRH